MNIITKAAATVSAVEDDAQYPHGAFDIILSAQSLDRDGDTLKSSEWKTPLPEHITMDADHGMSVNTTVGSGKPFINEDGNLQVRGTFSSIPRAQEVRTLVKEGHIKTTSVAFMTHRDKKSASVERELLNGAFVAIPANPEAVILSSKSVRTKDGASPAEDAHRHRLIQAADAAIDSALVLFAGVDADSLPPDIQQGIALVLAADKALDALADEMDIADPDEEPGSTLPDPATIVPGTAGKSADRRHAAAYAAANAKSADAVVQRARALQLALQSFDL